MKNNAFVRSSLAQAALELTPPTVRKSLLENAEFRAEYGFSADAVSGLGNTGISLQRSDLFEAVRDVLNGGSPQAVSDRLGNVWSVLSESADEKPPRVFICGKKKRHLLPDFSVLSQNREVRINSLELAIDDLGLPKDEATYWHDLLTNRSLEDEEVDPYFKDLSDTPTNVARLVRDEFMKSEGKPSTMVPETLRYFSRLVGKYDDSCSVQEYASSVSRQFMDKRSKWRPREGFLLCLLLSSHSTLTTEVNASNLKDGELLQVMEWLVERGDLLSQLGAIEVGLRILPDHPEIESCILRLLERMLEDNPDKPESRFNFLSAMFIFVDGTLANRRTFSGLPPFYRRMAALAQAALIQREALHAGIDTGSLSEWAFQHHVEPFTIQSFADMRRDPRWSPNYATPKQLKQEFLGRLMIAGKTFEPNISSRKLKNVLMGTGKKSVNSLSEFPWAYVPGPLEGQGESPVKLAENISQTIEDQLEGQPASPESFIALANSALIFQVDDKKVKLATETLKLSEYRLRNVTDASHLFSILHGLATLAAATRNASLADELRIVVRRYRQDTQNKLSINHAIQICLVSGASRPDLSEWRTFVGDWLTELAFDDFDDQEAEILHSRLQHLCHFVPELWVSTSKADAALQAYIGR
mgnify:FL=1